jgi:hypothetical protein
VARLPLPLAGEYAAELGRALDREGKIARGVDALGSVRDADLALVDAAGGDLRARLADAGARLVDVPFGEPLQTGLEDASVDVLVSPWAAFRGEAPADNAEADRVLRPAGRLVVIHDYGRDDVSRLRGDLEAYGTWSRRDGPFLANGFRIRVLHCWWTWDDLESMRAFLEGAFGERGAEVGAGAKRPRLSYNVAIYHRVVAGDRSGEVSDPSRRTRAGRIPNPRSGALGRGR